MVESCVCEILALSLYIDSIYKKAHGQTHLKGIVHVETIFQCCFPIQYHINHKIFELSVLIINKCSDICQLYAKC